MKCIKSCDYDDDDDMLLKHIRVLLYVASVYLSSLVRPPPNTPDNVLHKLVPELVLNQTLSRATDGLKP